MRMTVAATFLTLGVFTFASTINPDISDPKRTCVKTGNRRKA